MLSESETSIAQRLIPLIDLTSLNDDDNDSVIRDLCQQAMTNYGNVAAVCIYPRFVSLAKSSLKNTKIKIATVSNFPHGTAGLTAVLTEIKQALTDGADEIDVVMPYQRYLAGERAAAIDMIAACKQQMPTATLKVILETGVFPDENTITAASLDMIAAGADFIKTSTGKVSINATIPAARAMLTAIRQSSQSVGFKAAGGIRTVAQAAEYLQLAKDFFGSAWVTSNHFRIGASSLMQAILMACDQERLAHR